jgi:phage terminase large subunit-like protein
VYASEWIEGFCKITKESIAGRVGDPLVLRPWQHDLFNGLFARRRDGRRRFRVGLIGVPRKNTKSTMGSSAALWSLVEGPEGGEVYSCAGDKEQARIVFGTAKRMVELEPELGSIVRTYRDALEVPSTGSVYRCLSAEAYTKEGLNPTLVIFDELHVQPTDELWNTMNLGAGARIDPLILAITTAGVRSDQTGGDSICYRLYQHGRKVVSGEESDPSFFFAWWEAAESSDHRDPKTWRTANPGYDDLIDPEDFVSAVTLTSEAEFRIKRCNQWVSGMTAWLPAGVFEQHADRTVEVADGETITLGFDGSYSGDSTGLVGCTPEGHLFVVDAWEKPDGVGEWRVDIEDVMQSIREACARWRVVEIACDPYRWALPMQMLLEEDLPIVEWPTSSPARMIPACAKFYDALMGGNLTHDGDPRLERHLRNCVVKRDRLGPRIVKDSKESPRKIDLAVCAVIAHDRAVVWRDDHLPAIF